MLDLSSWTESIRAPNSTPMVTSWADWYRLSVNRSIRLDFPTPESPSVSCLVRCAKGTDDNELVSA